ncbi:uncharacterized protein LOC126034188 [Accipiter gentilis]|uniref:uncharacterized protein LOC126034188 n=1 Tax=Astur gentilis TaxID=8957 RepID=UPI00211026B5|nr:uncharacterized protein LOC126034188 [Accipiter gentilis]
MMLGLVPDSKTLFFSSGVPCGRVPFISHVPQVCACCSRSRDTVTAPAIVLCCPVEPFPSVPGPTWSNPAEGCSVRCQVLSIPVSPARSPCSPSEDVLGIAAALSRPPHTVGSTPLPSDAAFQIGEVKLGFAQKRLVSTVQSCAWEPECGHAALARSSPHLQLQTPLPKSTEVPDMREGGSRHRALMRTSFLLDLVPFLSSAFRGGGSKWITAQGGCGPNLDEDPDLTAEGSGDWNATKPPQRFPFRP